MVGQENVVEIQAFRAVMRHEIDQSSRVTGPAMLVDAVHWIFNGGKNNFETRACIDLPMNNLNNIS